MFRYTYLDLHGPATAVFTSALLHGSLHKPTQAAMHSSGVHVVIYVWPAGHIGVGHLLRRLYLLAGHLCQPGRVEDIRGERLWREVGDVPTVCGVAGVCPLGVWGKECVGGDVIREWIMDNPWVTQL
jgi:hypothetical protein